MTKVTFLCIGSVLLGFTGIVSAAPVDSLEAGFYNPPESAKPQTWWDWMDDNVTEKGITADLEAMKQIGLGGASVVNLDCGIPVGKVPFMSAKWQSDFKFAVQEASRLGLELSVANSDGWSNSGGPWITVTNAMQCLTSSELHIQGPTTFDAALPQPPVTLGFYRDIAVIAFKAPPAIAPKMVADTASSTASAEANLVIKRAFYEAADGASIKDGGGSVDVTRKIIDLIKSGRNVIAVNSWELGCDPAVGQPKRLRVEFTIDGKTGNLTAGEGSSFKFPDNASQLAEAESREKNNSVDRTFVRPPRATISPEHEAIPHDGVLDLTAKLEADGRLRWNVPPGDWIILRLGYTPIGVKNHPATKEGAGLECDKLSKVGIDAHWDGFMQKVIADIAPLGGKGLAGSLIDSYEVGNQDWTKNFREEFEKRRGYDPVPFLPTFTRRVVDDPAVTERFLWDMRRTIADLFADNYYGHFAELCRQHGLKSEVEPYYGPFESLQCGASLGVVMGEFWTGSHGHPSVKMAASVAHIYGKSVVGAEAFTEVDGRWQDDPYSFKTLGDLMFSQGVNRYYFHRYAMQPWTNREPGMTMGGYGINFERTVTWWNQGKAWIDYLSRCEFLLQQGRAVADAAYFDGQSVPVVIRMGNPPLPAGYDCDAVDADVLQHGATVKNGRLTLASGANYGVIILPPDDINMTPQILKCLRKLVRAGAIVVGSRPQHSPSLADYPQCDEEVKQLVDELWGRCDGTNILENKVGKGRVVWGKPLADVFAAQKLKPDFEFHGATTVTDLVYAHRVAGAADIYFVSNQRRQFDSAECTFRVTGKIPELWHPDTGVMETAPVWNDQDGRTTVRLNFDPAGSVFVIFRQASGRKDHVIAASGMLPGESNALPTLEVQRAFYAASDGTGAPLDVTAQVRRQVRDGQLDLAATTAVLGGDPAPYHVKELRVDYTLDGKPGHLTVREGDTLLLSAIGQPPQWEISPAADGSPVVKAWSDGQFELHTAAGKVLRADATNVPAPLEITGAWNLSFPPDWGAPPLVTLDKLMSWTDQTNAGVRYFSGTATYEKEIEIPAERLADGRELWLDLGAVKNLAEVSLNGHNFGVLWKPPFRVNITAAAKPNANKLVVKVTNLWPNRLIGDEQLSADCDWDGDRLKTWPQWLLDGKPSPTGRLTFTTWHHYTKDSPLLESGLLGPVTLRTAEIVRIELVK